jgi:hypothetical protein
VTAEDRQDVGVQLTTDVRPSQLAKKKKMIQRVKARLDPGLEVADIVLVALPIRRIRKTVETWERQGKLPGGPERLWGPATRERVFRAVMKGFIPDTELDAWWSKIQSVSRYPQVGD